MKKLILSLLTLSVLQLTKAQPMADTTGDLIAQKENVIKATTVIKVENLGFRVNSELPELRPTISADGNRLFFIVENHPMNTKYKNIPNSQDIWYSERDSSGKWQNAIHLDYPLNTTHYNAVYWISPDNNRILIRGAFVNGEYAGDGVSLSYMTEEGNWSRPEMLRIKNYGNYDRGKQSGAVLGHDGRTLIMYMCPKVGGLDNDIYVSFAEDDGTWTEPKSLGKKINLPGFNQLTPYIAPDGITLYFSCNRPGGMGDNDIWMTRRLDDTWTKWSEPVNLGSPINTSDWDAFFTMDAGGEYAYLTSSAESLGESDIVRVKLLERERPDPVVLVTGNVYNAKTKEPLQANLVYETLPDGKTAGNGVSSPGDGAFKIVLPFDKNYSIRASADHFFAVSENLNLDSLVKKGYKEIHKDLYLVPIEVGQVFRLNNVYFDFDKFNLREESFVELNRVVDFLNEHPTISIEISAHTDSKGSDEYNLKLSDNRAASCREYLVSKGIAADRVTSKGYGESKPQVDNDTDEHRQINRRVEFVILKN